MPSIYGPITLGELVEQLEATYRTDLSEFAYVKRHGDRQIYFDWCDMRPDYFHSYRGYYSELALAVRSYPTETVDEFIVRCKSEIGAVHQGWKGGEFTMGEGTSLWVVPKSGTCSGWGISGVRDEGYRVVLVTENFRD